MFFYINCHLMKLQKSSTMRKQEHECLKIIKQHMNRQSLAKQHQLIRHLTPKLEIKFSQLMKVQWIKNFSEEVVLQACKNIDFLHCFDKQVKGVKQKIVKIQYQSSRRTLLVTGINHAYIDTLIGDFNRMAKFQYQSKSAAKKVGNNSFWIAIETITNDMALHLKKFLRNKKKSLDIEQQNCYKIQRKRVRIIILEEDFFTLLVDAMTDSKSDLFIKNFEMKPLNKTEENSITWKHFPAIIYKSMGITQQNQPIENRQEDMFDYLSESNSLNSEMKDEAKRFQQIPIEKADQGIQSQNNIEQYIEEETLIKQAKISASNVQISTNTQIGNKDEQITIKKQKNNSLQQIEEKINKKEQEEKQLVNDRYQYLNEIKQHETEKTDLAIFHRQSQTDENLYTVIKYALMKRYLKEFEQKKHQYYYMRQIPEYAKRQSDNERYRHLFFSSICKKRNLKKSQEDY